MLSYRHSTDIHWLQPQMAVTSAILGTILLHSSVWSLSVRNAKCVNLGKSVASGTRSIIVVVLLVGHPRLVLVNVCLPLYTLFHHFLICFPATRSTSNTPKSLAHGWPTVDSWPISIFTHNWDLWDLWAQSLRCWESRWQGLRIFAQYLRVWSYIL